ncbi:hypothetical protein ACRAWC_20595 [Leifsonia sp. L25]|uniref:hypothetical protein n=1 Tax=Leifsonia sp. L25 TaxID=3423957 RepID=UPI003D68B36F
MGAWRERSAAHACSSPGAASGMGRLYAERAVLEGARAVVLWDRDEAALMELTHRLRREVLAGRTAAAWGAPEGSPSSAAGRPATSVLPYVVDLSESWARSRRARRPSARRSAGSTC